MLNHNNTIIMRVGWDGVVGVYNFPNNTECHSERLADIRARAAGRQNGAKFPTLAGGMRSLVYNHLAWVSMWRKQRIGSRLFSV